MDRKELLTCCATRVHPEVGREDLQHHKKGTSSFHLGAFRHLLVGQLFEVFSDHASLQWLHSMWGESALLHCWKAELEEYQCKIIHRPGKLQGHVEGLSRLPQDICSLQLPPKVINDLHNTQHVPAGAMTSVIDGLTFDHEDELRWEKQPPAMPWKSSPMPAKHTWGPGRHRPSSRNVFPSTEITD